MTWNFNTRRALPGLVLGALATGLSLNAEVRAPEGWAPEGWAQEAAQAAPAVASDAEILGDALVVDGVTVSADALKRQLVFLSQEGRTLFQLAQLRKFIQNEMERQINEEGKTLENFDVADEEVQKAIEEAREQVAAQYTGQDVKLEDVFPDINSPAWLDNLRLSKLFRKVFLPKNPNEYPPITVTAITAGDNGDQLYGALVDQWDTAQAEKAVEGPEAPGAAADDAGQQFMDMLLQQTVVGYLTEASDIKLAEDGIADTLMAVVDGEEITVDSIWQQIRGTVGPMDVWRAKVWFVNKMAAEKALKASGAWVSKEEAEAMYEAYAEPYKKSFLSIPKIATVIKKFPTLGNYKDYYQIQESFRKLEGDNMTDEALKEQGDRKTSYLVSQAKVDVDVILLSAYDFKAKAWKENGWMQAEQRAIEVAQKLAEGAEWDELVDEYSEFYDQPIPTESQNRADLKLKNKGRFRGITRNDLLRFLDESDYSTFLVGGSITDMIFFEQTVGTIENPVKGPHGYYIPRLLRKTPPTARLSVTDSDHREYLTQDWISDNLNRFVQEQVAGIEVSGVDL